MPAIYKMKENPPKSSKGGKVVLHPRVVSRGTMDTQSIIALAADRSSFTPGDLEGALRLFSDLLGEMLKSGYDVKLDGIGYFSVSLQSRPVTDKKELRSESVHFKNVNFRCCAELKKRLKTMELSRLKEPKKADCPVEERVRRVLWYLERHPYLTTMNYRGLNACSDYQARKELAQLVADGVLTEIGTRKVKMYVKTPEPVELPDSLVVNSNVDELK